MVPIIIATTVSALFSLLVTPKFINFLVKKNLGQFIRQDGPETHFTKRGTPTMGGVMIILATVVGWFFASLELLITTGKFSHASSVIVLFLMVAMGFVGFLDDYAKISHKQSLGLSPKAKIILQSTVGIIFAIFCLSFPDETGQTPANPVISVTDHFEFNLEAFGNATAIVLFIIWVIFLITAWTNAINLTDGLDGLATGCSLISFAGYILIAIWMSSQSCTRQGVSQVTCFWQHDSLEIAILCAAIVGACFGFLWWNTNPARIFMGDTGSLALGGAFAGISIVTNTQILAVLIGGIFVLESLSDVIQVSYFKMTRKRVFKMAPIHHHFELKGWQESQTVVRFWMMNALFVMLGIVVFYSHYLVQLW